MKKSKRKGFKKPPPKMMQELAQAAGQGPPQEAGAAPAPDQAGAPPMTDEDRMQSRYGG